MPPVIPQEWSECLDLLALRMDQPQRGYSRSRQSLRACGMTCCALLALAGCAQHPPAPDPPREAPLHLSLEHLRHLGLAMVVGGHPVRPFALSAGAPDYNPTG